MSDRRLLLVSYHFGPDGPTGGFRWFATSRHLRANGWDVDVVTVARPGPQASTEADCGQIGRLEIFSVPQPHWPSRIKSTLVGAGQRLRALRGDSSTSGGAEPEVDPGELFVWSSGYRRSKREQGLHGLDYLERAAGELSWARQAHLRARALAAQRRYRAILVSSPPHLTHTVGVRIAREFGLPYVADYRDPWTLGLGAHVAYVTGLERLLGRRFEGRAMRAAHSVIHNTVRARDAVASEFRLPGSHHAIPNGYDSREPVAPPDAKCFRVLYTGHLYPFMDIRSLLAACARLRERHDFEPHELSIEFVGTLEHFDRFPLTSLADAYGLSDVFSRRDRVPRAEASELQQAAAVLVAFDWLYPISVVSKFYEYTRMKGCLLLIGNRRGALADAASKVGLDVIEPSDAAAIDRALDAAVARWRRGDLDTPIDRDHVFDRRRQSERLLELLDGLPGREAATSAAGSR